ncbi:alpha/beta hydrolase fold domain-containing protein [Pseudokordiimonas caeni]|uniref:alpha/beta hydrolase fold domain-containing protein n=1 Tax=Pseudokordiimonas caeni TaxID=2997908 RepID=UPI00281146D9|nr:alpha/beta hydrolase fold domain-containing protein [Pseudokordiimonas caeni]
MSIRAWLARRQIRRAFRGKTTRDLTPDQLVKLFGGLLAKAEQMAPALPASVKVTPVEGAGFRGEWVEAPGALPARSILHFHGGGYVWGGIGGFRDFAMRLSTAAKAKVFLLQYRVAPEHPCPAAVEDAVAAWKALAMGGVPVMLGGDSAGGGLAVALVQALAAEGIKGPAALGLIAPWVDLGLGGSTFAGNAESDVMLDPRGIGRAAELYRGGLAASDPRCSPLFGRMDTMPPTLLQVDAGEILLDDSRRLAAKIREAGGKVQLDIWKGLFHDWPMVARLVPEGRKAIADMARHYEAYWNGGEAA